MKRPTDNDQTLNIIFNVHIEQDQADKITLVNSILQLEAFSSTFELQSIMHIFQEIYLIIRKCMFLLQDSVEAVAIDDVISLFVVYEDATFILMFFDRFETLCKQDNVYTCTHVCQKTSLVAIEDINNCILITVFPRIFFWKQCLKTLKFF
jgi:hypothetical protein